MQFPMPRGRGLRRVLLVLGLLAALRCCSGDEAAPLDPSVAGASTDTAASDLGAAEPAAARGTASLESTRARVAAGKLAAQAALNNPDAAWEAYLAGQRAQIAAAQASPSAARELPERLAVLAADATTGPRGLARRKRVFLRNLRDINRRNAESGDTLAFGINDFTHLTDKEFQRIYLSSLPPAGPKAAGSRKLLQTARVYQCNAEVPFPFGNVAIRSVDHRDLGTVTPVRSQGKCGSCALFAAMAAIESAYVEKWRGNGTNSANTDLSEQDLLNCTEGDGCDGGAANVYVDRVVCKGVTTESAVRYRAADKKKCSKRVDRPNSGVVAWASVPASERSFAQALAHNPLIIGLSGNALKAYVAGVFGCDPGLTVNHAVTLVAYNTNWQGPDGQQWRVFTAKNSWGANWGEQGFVPLRADCPAPGNLQMYDPGFPGTLPIRG